MKATHAGLIFAVPLLALSACTRETVFDGKTESALPAVPSRTFSFSYKATIPAPPPGTRQLSVWVPLPKRDDGVQAVSDLAIKAPSGWRMTREAAYGNRMIHFTVADPTGPAEISWTATVRRMEDRGQGALPSNPKYIQANKLIPIDGAALEIAMRIGAKEADHSLHWRTRRIFDDVLDSMEYNKLVSGYGFGSFHRAITVCLGNCTDFHARFIGVARAAGIPVRFTMGIPMQPAAEGQYDSYHCWAHYHDGRNWHPVDISEADKISERDPKRASWFFRHLDQHRIALTFGRDLVLEPPQKSEPLNYFVFPHAEADGQPMKLNKSMWEFTYKNV